MNLEDLGLSELKKSDTININGGEKEWLLLFGAFGIGVWVGYNKYKLEQTNKDQ